jgi:hypothetical protein
MTPLPMPEMTPPQTTIYLTMAGVQRLCDGVDAQGEMAMLKFMLDASEIFTP